MIVAIILLMINIYILMNTKEPKNLSIVKEKYRILRQHIQENGDEDLKVLVTEIPLTAHQDAYFNTLGYNTNKGYEIGLCIDGSPNQIFHVLLHELAHSTVSEYDHSENFWDKTRRLKDISHKLGIYEPIPDKTRFCSSYIQDK